MNRHVATSLALSFALAACGGGAPAPQTPESAATPEATTGAAARAVGSRGVEGKGRPQVSQELGSIDKTAVDAVFLKLTSQFRECQKKAHAQAHLEYLSGDFRMFLRVGEDGKVKYGYFEETSIGDRATEKCLLDAASAASWPKPQGGEAEVRRSAGLTPPDVREPTEWSADKIAGAVGGNAAVKKCTEGVTGSFQITAYVVPDGKDGKVSAAGVSPPSKDGAAKADCIADALKGMKTSTPGSYAAKVTFKL
jgi:hypothetical protein